MYQRIILQKAGSALITLLLASMVIFTLIRLAPGDPIDLTLGLGPGDVGVNTEMLEERKEELRAQYGLNDSIPVQYLNWLRKLASFDLGKSMQTGTPVVQELGQRIPATLLLSLAALLIETSLGLLLGFYSAIKAGKAQDDTIRIVCVLFSSLPAFVMSLLLLFLFAVKLHWYEVSSQATLHRLWLPAIVLGVIGSPQIVRMVRAAMLSELGKLYVSASQSRGLSRWLILRGALQNALLPIITTLALSFAHLIGGAVVIESIFSWPGLGNYALNSILIHDYPAVQGYTILTVSTIILINFLVEATYMMADPRTRRIGDQAERGQKGGTRREKKISLK